MISRMLLFQLVATAYSLPSTPGTDHDVGRIDAPDSKEVIHALSDGAYYDILANPLQQSPIHPSNPFNTAASNICGTKPVCPPFEGDRVKVNGREYKAYCINAPWGDYFWLPTSESLADCEQKCHDRDGYDCNALTFYPITGACSIIHSRDSQPYIWNNGYQKIGLIRADSDVAFGPGMVCPLPGSDNQVWNFGDDENYQFKMSCRNSFNPRVFTGAKKRAVGIVENVDQCAMKCGEEKDCEGFYYYQPSFPGGAVNGKRSCDLIMSDVSRDEWAPFDMPNKGLAGLRVQRSRCGDEGWNRDESARL